MQVHWRAFGALAERGAKDLNFGSAETIRLLSGPVESAVPFAGRVVCCGPLEDQFAHENQVAKRKFGSRGIFDGSCNSPAVPLLGRQPDRANQLHG